LVSTVLVYRDLRSGRLGCVRHWATASVFVGAI
jgi:hypothetical protein